MRFLNQILRPLIALVASAVPAAADYTIEQTLFNNPSSSGPSIERGQSFTTTSVVGGFISQVDISLDDINNDCDAFDLRIYQGNQSPDNPSLALYCEGFSGLPTAGWASMILSQGVPVQPNTQYTWEVKGTSGTNLALFTEFSNNPYAGGHRWRDGDGQLSRCKHRPGFLCGARSRLPGFRSIRHL